MKEKIIIALDTGFEDAKNIIQTLGDKAVFYKVNSLYIEHPEIIKIIKDTGCKVFLDLKFNDIPNTVANYAKAVTKMGVDIFTIHTSGGVEMMQAAAQATKEAAEKLNIKKPLVLGITVLTSISQEILNNDLNVAQNIQEQVLHLADLALKAGLDGIVASVKEAAAVKKCCGQDFVVLTPGIRPSWSASQDQKRVATPADAIKNGSDYLVVGRAITNADNRLEALQKLLQEIE